MKLGGGTGGWDGGSGGEGQGRARGGRLPGKVPQGNCRERPGAPLECLQLQDYPLDPELFELSQACLALRFPVRCPDARHTCGLLGIGNNPHR